MDLFGRFRKLDSSLQRGLDNGFARVFGGEVVPAEIDELLKQEVEDAIMEDRSGTLHAPSTFEVHLAARDYENLVAKRPDLDRELRDRLNRFIRNEGWSTSSPVAVDLIRDDGMHTGQLKCRSSFTAAHERTTGPRQDAASAQDAAQDAGRDGGQDPAGAPEWPRSGPDSGRSPVAQSYNADGADGAPSDAGDAAGSAGSAGSAGAAGAAGAAAGAGALAGLAHAQRRPTGWGRQDDAPSDGEDADRPDPQHGHDSAYRAAPAAPAAHVEDPAPTTSGSPETEVVTGPQADAVNGVDGLLSTGSGGYQSAPQRTVTMLLQDGSNRTYVLKQGSNTIGRGNQVDFRLPDTGVSRRHADITWDGFDAVLTDLRSTNGTTVNEIPVENWLLADGDVIALGHSSIEVRFS